jgi:phytoene dehydrogenase-like protein
MDHGGTPAAPTVIVGGGIAGLMCARELCRAGHPTLLLESADEVGGRVRTTVTDGFRLDHGFQVLFTAYPTLTAALDLPALLLREFQPAARIAGTARGGSALIGDALADPGLLLPTLRAPQLSVSDKLRLLRLRYFATGLSFDDCFAPQYDGVSTLEFLRTRGFSRDAIAHFFSPFYGGILLDRSLQTSASVLLYTFRMLALGRTAVPSLGMGAISQQLAGALGPETLRTNARVAAVLPAPHARWQVILNSGEQIAARSVVLACDPVTTAALASGAGVRMPATPAALGCTTVYLQSSRAILAGDALWLNAAPQATVSHAITLSNVAPSYAPTNQALTSATVLGAEADREDRELVQRVRSDLVAMSGQDQAASAELLGVWRVPFSQYAQPPGAVARRIPGSTAMDGLFIASEWSHTSSLEGAARGGVAAAGAVLRSVSGH